MRTWASISAEREIQQLHCIRSYFRCILQAEAYGCLKGLHRCIEWNYSSSGGTKQQQIPAWLQQAIDLLTVSFEDIESKPSLAAASKQALTANTFWHVST
jgi:hypothetical protein